jgi:hypothetical protein
MKTEIENKIKQIKNSIVKTEYPNLDKEVLNVRIENYLEGLRHKQQIGNYVINSERRANEVKIYEGHLNRVGNMLFVVKI